MPGWLPPTLVVLVAAVVIAALDLGRRREKGPREDDVHWFAGVFYFNRGDRRLMVPKRYGLGLGQTLNFANPVAWAILLAPVLVAILGAASRSSS